MENRPAYLRFIFGQRPWLFFLLASLFFTAFEFTGRLAGGYVLAPEDGLIQNYPGFAGPELLWTARLFTGFPVAGDPQIAVFYPLRLICRLLPDGFNIYVLSAFFLASFFASLYCYKLTGSRLAGLVGGTLYAFGGYQISELRHVQVLHAAVWLPLLFLLVDCLRLSRWPSLLWLSLAFACCILAGHPQTAAYIIASVLAYSVAGLRLRAGGIEDTQSQPFMVFVCTLAALLFALAMSAVQILPALELSELSARAAFTFKDFIVGQVEPSQLLGFAIPYLLGGSYGSLSGLPFAEQGPPPGLLFYGIGTLILAVLAWRERSSQPVVFFNALFFFCVFYSLGEHNGLAHLFARIPPFDHFRVLYRVLLPAAFALSVLASLGVKVLSALGGEEPDGFCRRALFEQWRRASLKKHFLWASYIFLSLLIPPLLPGTLPLYIFFRRRNFFTAAVLVLSLYAVLLSYAWTSHWYSNCPSRTALIAPPGAALLQEKLSENGERIFTVKGCEAPPQAFPPNLSKLWGVSSVNGYSPLVPSRYARLLNIAQGGFLCPPWRIDEGNRAFDICSVRYLLAPDGEFTPAFHDRASTFWPLLKSEGGVVTYENKRCLPRFRLVNKVRQLADEEIFRVIRQGSFSDGSAFEPRDTALVDNYAANSWPAGRNEIRIAKLTDADIELNVSLENAAFLVVADQYYPGWKAEVDGCSQTIIRTNYIQQGLPLAAGKHLVHIFYDPQSLRTGLIVSGSALTVWLVCFLLCSLGACRFKW